MTLTNQGARSFDANGPSIAKGPLILDQDRNRPALKISTNRASLKPFALAESISRLTTSYFIYTLHSTGIKDRERGYNRHTNSSTFNRRPQTMSEPEKMEALKRAYAEMILNTAKEAAARVLVAESRARKLEQDLVCTKDEATRMLICLKQMIDAKTKEAEITSLDQHEKIDVLESQLSEAEGIIIDLRAELNQTHEQLYEAKNKKLYFSRDNENHSVSDELKEPELLRNGCTQRVFATETSVNPDPNFTDIEIVNGVNELVSEEQFQAGKNEEVAVSIVRRSTRKRKLKYLDDVMTACGLNRSSRFKKCKAENVESTCISEKQG
ncbi:hypothetical protein CASFOL_033008 [Castilleja foliolosa]|uniref:Uncharacterized protein n=1 Tax=Castilleja foliolosa TaxID=1961234 RepID=A0ABD3C3R3_9LAMI